MPGRIVDRWKYEPDENEMMMTTMVRVSSSDNCELKESPRCDQIDTLDGLLETLQSTRFTVFIIFCLSFLWALAAQMFVMAAYLAPFGNSIGGQFTTVQEEWPDIPVVAAIDASEFVSSATFVGSLLLGFFPGVLSDRFGRKAIISWSLLCIAVTGALSALAPSYLFLLIVRLIQGFFLNSVATVNFVHCMESVAENRRYVAACACGLFWCIGYAILAPTSLLVKNWRWMIGVHSFVALLASAVMFVAVPESPYYCVSQKNRRLLHQFVKSAEWWNQTKYDVDYDTLLEVKGEEPEKNDSRITIIDSLRFIFRKPRLLVLLAVEGYTQIATLLAYTGLSIASTSLEVGDANWNFVLSGLVELPAYCGVPKLCDLLGTKITMLILFPAASVALIVLKFVGPGIPALYVILWLISKCLVTACYYSALIVSTELFPTKCRSFAVAFGLTLSNIGSIFGPHVGALNVFYSDLAFLVFAAALAIAAVLLAIFVPRKTHFEA